MRPQYTVAATALLMFLTACGGPKTARVEPAQSEPVAQSTPAEAGAADVTARMHVSRAIASLQAGDAETARQDLQAALASEPDNAKAKLLMEQIDTDPQAYFGAESFDYTVEVGESLSALSQRFLDNRLKFYALARYNGIAKPSLVEAGSTIRIPGTATAVAAQAKAVNTMPATAAGPVVAPAAANIAAAAVPATPAPKPAPAPAPVKAAPVAAAVPAGECASAIPGLEQQVKEAPTDNARKALLKCYSEQADALAKAGKYEDAQRTLQKAIMVDRTDPSITQQLVALVGVSQVERLYQKGVDEAAAGKLEEANATLTDVLSKSPNHAGAKAALADVRAKLADRYHGMAMSLYNRQQMDRALALWDRVLELEPNHKEALAYSAKAREQQK